MWEALSATGVQPFFHTQTGGVSVNDTEATTLKAVLRTRAKTGDNGCKGKNSCKGKGGCKTDESADKLASTMGQKAVMALDDSKHSCKGKNACKGQGGCKTGDNGCKGKNSCKGKGGCKTDESADKLFVAPFAR